MATSTNPTPLLNETMDALIAAFKHRSQLRDQQSSLEDELKLADLAVKQLGEAFTALKTLRDEIEFEANADYGDEDPDDLHGLVHYGDYE